MLSSSSRVSEAGSNVKLSIRSIVRWSAGSNWRTLSISSPKKSSRSAWFFARREEIDQRATDRKLAGIGNRVRTDIAVRLEQRRELVAIDALTRRESRDELADAERGERALGGGIDRGDDQLRAWGLPAGSAWSAASRSDDDAATARRDHRAGNPRPGAGESRARARNRRGLGNRAHRDFVGRDEHQARAPLACAARARSASSHGRKPGRRRRRQRRGALRMR